MIDAETREPLPGAVITMLGTSMGANTDLDGRYTISNVPVGTYTVQAKMMGYETQNITGIKSINVAPRAGAWIETRRWSKYDCRARRPPRGGVD